MEPVIAGCHAPYLDVDATAEFLCVAEQPVLEVLRILDACGLTLLNGRGKPLSPGAEPCWLTVLSKQAEQSYIVLKNSAGTLFSPCLIRGEVM